MKITLLALGNKMPDWVDKGILTYQKRLQAHYDLSIVEIPLQRRSKVSMHTRVLEKETQLMMAAIPANAYLIALDLNGKAFSSEQLAVKMAQLEQVSSHLCFLIGGPEGLSASILDQCKACWALSKLTLPHPLVRIVFLEALYRAWSISANHPYHK